MKRKKVIFYGSAGMNKSSVHRFSRCVSLQNYLSPCLVILLTVVCDCAGVRELTVPPEQQKPHLPPPDVTGTVRLTFLETFGENAGISSPWGISFGVDGTLYICDRDRSSIIRLDSKGTSISRFSGFGSRVERLYSPIDVCSTGGIPIYAIDAANSRVLRFDRNLKNAFVIYKKDTAENRLFSSFNGLAFDKTSGDLFITDRDSGALIRIDMLGGSINSRGAFGSGKESFQKPAGLDVADDGTIYIADRGAGAIAVLDHFGAKIRHIGAGILEDPVDAAALPDSRIAVADRSGVLVLSGKGIPEGRAGYGIDRVMSPRSVAFNEGNLYVSDSVTASILVYTYEKQ